MILNVKRKEKITDLITIFHGLNIIFELLTHFENVNCSLIDVYMSIVLKLETHLHIISDIYLLQLKHNCGQLLCSFDQSKTCSHNYLDLPNLFFFFQNFECIFN